MDTTTIALNGGTLIDLPPEYDDIRNRAWLVEYLAAKHPGKIVYGFPQRNVVEIGVPERRPAHYGSVPMVADEAITRAKIGLLHANVEAEGFRLVSFNAFNHEAVVAKLDPHTVAIRERFADILKCDPSDIDLSIDWVYDEELKTGRIESITLRDSPLRNLGDAERRAGKSQELIEAVGGNAGWEVSEITIGANVIITLTYGKPPALRSLVHRDEVLLPAIDKSRWHSLPVGKNADDEIISLNLKAGPHSLVVGGTGSGKSVTLRVIMSVAISRGFDVVLIDPVKNAAGLKNLAPFTKGIFKADREEASNVLTTVYEEVERRVALIDRYDGENWQDIPEEHRPKPMMIVIDEYASLVKPKAKPAFPKGHPKMDEWEEGMIHRGIIADEVGKIAREARSAGVHLVISMQRADTKYIEGDVRENLGTTIHLVTPTAPPSKESLKMLFNDRSRDAQEEIRVFNDGSSPGLAVSMVDGGTVQAFRVALIEPKHVPDYMERINAPQCTNILSGNSAPAEVVEDGRIVFEKPDDSVFNLWERLQYEKEQALLDAENGVGVVPTVPAVVELPKAPMPDFRSTE